MSDFERDEELSQKYGKVMGSIADDIRQINLDKKEPIILNDVEPESEKQNFDESNTESEIGIVHDKFFDSVYSINFDNPDEVLKSVGFDENEFDTAPLKNISDFDDVINEIRGYDAIEDYPDTLSCEECRELLYDYVSDVTDETENMSIGAHLNNCEMCRIELDDIRDMLGVISADTVPSPPSDLISGIHEKLVAIAPEVKDEYTVLKQSGLVDGGLTDKIKLTLETLKDKTNHFIRHANWKVVAPAALSAVLVVGVAGSGVYQVMKSSDEVYNFSDNEAIANARATAKPSASGLDDYLTAKPSSSPAPKTSSTPKPTASNASASPKATAKPSATSSGLSIGSGSASSSSNKTSSTTTGGSTSTKSTTSSSSGSTSRTTSSTSSNTTKKTTASPTATPKPYVAPRIILPDIASGITSPTYVAPDTVSVPENTVPDPFIYTPSATSEEPETEQSYAGGNVSASASGVVESPEPTVVPSSTPKPAASATPKPSNSATPRPDVSSTPSPVATPSVSAAPELERNNKGETKAFEDKSDKMDDASVISCVIENDDVYNVLMNSALANCSKIEENGETTLYLTGDEYVKYTEFMEANNLTYRLVVLGKNDDVKVIILREENK